MSIVAAILKIERTVDSCVSPEQLKNTAAWAVNYFVRNKIYWTGFNEALVKKMTQQNNGAGRVIWKGFTEIPFLKSEGLKRVDI